ncbi:DUF697 domain-containing protein [Phormidium sp. CLA17]|uniref:slr1306 family protein n=1 Tax=Leptolyngbya sp. Cla-17 TaxID=2803751 RepID=UPI001492E50D|nr:DUF697 domain-containing protein [Leptolyngbya sp. Cla-17]MBM0742422.1 DUF697 domain-containing protein [Leptolyngbya sp. Cla-17]
MAEKLQRPLVIGGITLAIALWMLEFLHQAMGEWGIYTVGALAVSGGVWWVQRQSQPLAIAPISLRTVDSAAVNQALSEASQVLTRLQVELVDAEPALQTVVPHLSFLQAQANQISTEMNREALRLMVMGGKGSGKTTLIQHLQDSWAAQSVSPGTLYEAPSFAAGNAEASGEAVALKQVMTADLLLFLVTGDLTESEFRLLKQLAVRKRTVLIFNKQDLYLPQDRQMIVARMQDWARSIALPDVVAIATAPKPIKVRQHQPDGSVQEWLEDQLPDLDGLTQRLTSIVQAESRQLVMSSSLSDAIALKAQAANTLNIVRKTRALPIIEQFQWIAAATAFASPVPTLDVLATAAINTQMILDLGKLYQQNFSLDQAQKVVTALGGLILKLGLVELSTRTVSNLLKTNAITYVAGGGIQAVSAAYLTRMVGLALVEYFHTQDPALAMTEAKPLAIERFSQVLQAVFQQNQQTKFLQTLTTQVIDQLMPKPVSPKIPPVATIAASSTTSTVAPVLLKPIPLARMTLPQPEAQLLDHNGSSVHVALADLDSIPSDC